jgi:hypothetical protein
MRVLYNVVGGENTHSINCGAHTTPEYSLVFDITRLPLSIWVRYVLEKGEYSIGRLNESQNYKDAAFYIVKDITISHMERWVDTRRISQFFNPLDNS